MSSIPTVGGGLFTQALDPEAPSVDGEEEDGSIGFGGGEDVVGDGGLFAFRGTDRETSAFGEPSGDVPFSLFGDANGTGSGSEPLFRPFLSEPVGDSGTESVAFSPDTSAAPPPSFAPGELSADATEPTEVVPTDASAPSDGAAEGRSVTDLVSTVLPDALVYTNGPLLAGDKKHFALANLSTGTAVHFIKHADRPVPTPAWLSAWGPLTQVETITYSASGARAKREDGIGGALNFGKGRDQFTVFLNTRGGDTNGFAFNQPQNGVSLNMGFFGPPKAVERFIDNLPESGKSGQLKKALEKTIDVAGFAGSQYGAGWRATLTHDAESGEAILDISGFKIKMADFVETFEQAAAPEAENYGDRSVAALNNEEAYIAGANPFEHAEATREPLPNGEPGRYLNHGEPVAAIAGDTLALQQALYPDDPPIRTNAEARTFIEKAVSRSDFLAVEDVDTFRRSEPSVPPIPDPDRLTGSEQDKLETLLVNLDGHGLYFGSPVIERAAGIAAESTDGPGVDAAIDPEDRQFVRDVFEGDFRRDDAANDGFGLQDIGELLLSGVNRHVAVASAVLDAEPVADASTPARALDSAAEGFAARMDLEGGTLASLGLEPSDPGREAAEEEIATDTVFSEMAVRLRSRNEPITAEGVFQEYRSLNEIVRFHLVDEVRSRIDGAPVPPILGSGDEVVSIDGVALSGDAVHVTRVVARNSESGEALRGDVMTGLRRSDDTPVYWLQGSGTNYLLATPGGSPITDPVVAEERARELIANGAATDLETLDRVSFAPG